MGYRLVVLPTALRQIGELPKSVRQRVANRLSWLCENASLMIHHPLSGMPLHLAGLCKLWSGDYRILYWKFPNDDLIEVFAVGHRSEIYRKFA